MEENHEKDEAYIPDFEMVDNEPVMETAVIWVESPKQKEAGQPSKRS